MTGQQEPRTYHFCSICDAKRLDTYLTDAFRFFSRSFFQHLLKDGRYVYKNGHPVKATTTVSVGDVLSVTFPKLKTLDIIPEDIPLDVLYEDDYIIVINKAPGIVVHPTERGGYYSGTIVNALLHRLPDKFSGIKGERRPGIVHRLDKDTSGVLIIAKDDQSLGVLGSQFKDRVVRKEYLTLVRGHFKEDHGHIDAPIGRDPQDRKKMAVSDHPSSREAHTEFYVLERHKDTTLLRVLIHTGRTHQIRVHFASIGHPVVGDSTYGDTKLNKQFKDRYTLERQFLHAWRLELKHPRSGELLSMEAPLSSDLQNILDQLNRFSS